MPSGRWGNRWKFGPESNLAKGMYKDRTAEVEESSRPNGPKWWTNLNSPSIIALGSLFNEAWGLIKTTEDCKPDQRLDPTSTNQFLLAGEILKWRENWCMGRDISICHNVYLILWCWPVIYGKKSDWFWVNWGFDYQWKSHLLNKDIWGYQELPQKKSSESIWEIDGRVSTMPNSFWDLPERKIYFKTLNVEIETNGLMTYDRRSWSLNADFLKKSISGPLNNRIR